MVHVIYSRMRVIRFKLFPVNINTFEHSASKEMLILERTERADGQASKVRLGPPGGLGCCPF